jgi:hypothetical protein
MRFIKYFIVIVFLFSALNAGAQTSIISTDSVAEQIMLGNYNPSDFASSNPITHPDSITQAIIASVSPDSLKSYIETLGTFYNRNTGSDTVSNVMGIGAARRWAFSKFAEFSALNENRLIPSYLQFDTVVCGSPQHRNIFAVLPGVDTSDKSIIFMEGHIDSRCSGECDTACLAQGMEDNGSGSALVLELARVMSRFTFKHTIVFLLTIGEEQGLFGAEAFAMYCQQKNIKVKAVQNNDIVGGILCGNTSSPPSCPGFGNVDSLQVRIFSFGNFNSAHKQYARYCKLEYRELALPHVSVPTTITIMTAEDRTGRGGDHIPFRSHFFTAIRFTSANEAGSANVTDTSYHDRQHTSDDILGVDTNGDLVIDSFFVDFHYLARNAVINGNGAAMAALTYAAPDFVYTPIGIGKLVVSITQQTQYAQYRLGVRIPSHNDWDSIYTINGLVSDTLIMPAGNIFFVSVAGVDSNGIETLFSREYSINVSAVEEINKSKNNIVLLPARPNPADEEVTFTIVVNKAVSYKNAYLRITSEQGKEITRLKISLESGINEVNYHHGYDATGTRFASLVVDGKGISTIKIIFSK